MEYFLLEIDPAGGQAILDRLAGSLDEGFARTSKEIAQQAGRSVDITIKKGGRPDPFKPLDDSTIEYREHLKEKTRGRLPVAGIRDPLRLSDALRKAASATRTGIDGGNFSTSPWGFENEITLPYAGRQAAMRPFDELQDSDEESFADMVFADVRARCRRAEQGQNPTPR